jgi:predicted phosphatase
MAASDRNFRDVLARFTIGLGKDEVEDFRFATLEDVHKVIVDLQIEQAKSKRMMNLPRIRSFLEAMEQFGKVIEIFLNTTEFVAFIWVREQTLSGAFHLELTTPSFQGPTKFLLLVGR